MVLELLDLHCMRRCFHVCKGLFLLSCHSLQLAASNLRIYMRRVAGLGSTASSGTSSFGKRILSMVIKAFITKKCCRGFLVTEITFLNALKSPSSSNVRKLGSSFLFPCLSIPFICIGLIQARFQMIVTPSVLQRIPRGNLELQSSFISYIKPP